MRKILQLLLLFFVCQGTLSFGQMNISFPMQNAVFQRNSGNQATIYIAGKYSTNQLIDKVEAQLVPVNGGYLVDWTTIATIPLQGRGNYYGSLTASAGWYILNVRTKNGNTVVESTTLNRVGVGEVFIIAGQSNSQGILNYGSVEAIDERVVNHNYDGLYDYDPNFAATYTCSSKYPPYPDLSRITASTYISKFGQSSWSYGKLGDLVSSTWGVPVAFYSAGASGSSSINWRESADGLATMHSYTGQTYCNVPGTPYSVLKTCLSYYASLFGVRAIIWHQGETDTSSGTSAGNYTNNINYVINKSRSDFGANVPWLISRVSYNQGATSSEVITGQNNLINSGNQVFAGPNTDGILPRVRDNLHFSDQTLIDFANALYNSIIDANLFGNSMPIQAHSLPQVSINCNGNGSVTLTAPSGYSSYKWVNGNGSTEDATLSNSQSFVASSGTYRCWLKNGNNYVVTQAVEPANALNSCTNPISCSSVTYVSNLLETGSSMNGYGPIQYDLSNGGNTMIINGTSYAKGLGVHANSQIVYNLNGLYGRFIADLGIDDEINATSCGGSGATVIYQVFKDNVLAYQSSTINRNSATIKLSLNVSGVSQLKLIVTDAGDGFSCDHADWAGARLHCVDNQAPSPPSNLVFSLIGTKCAKFDWTGSTDNMEVQYYYIYVNNVLKDSVAFPTTTYNISNLTANTSYAILIKAKDYSGNISQFGATNNLTTLANNLTISSSKPIINYGDPVTLTAVGCSGTVFWFNGQVANSTSFAPTQSKIYKAICQTNTCNSDSVGVAVQVLAACQSSVILNLPLSNYSNFVVGAGQTITANNVLTSSRITYQGGNFVMLLPGFKADNTNVFVAKIQSCCIITAPTIAITSLSLCNSTLTATGCAGTLSWSNASTGNSIVVSSNTSNTYSATCKVGTCTSISSNSIKVPNIPITWANTDIGTPPVSGCTLYDGSGTLTIQGTGVILSGTDQCHYVYKSFSASNTSIIAKVLPQTISASSGMRSGIMLRTSNAPNAPFFEVIIDNNNSSRFVAKVGRGLASQTALLYGYVPIANNDIIWLKIDKVGSSLTASFSKDGGTTWTIIGENIFTQPTISFGSSYLGGFSSNNDDYGSNSISNQTVFSNIIINGVAF